MFTKLELLGAAGCIAIMSAALYVLERNPTDSSLLPAALSTPVVVTEEKTETERAQNYLEAVTSTGEFKRMVIDDVKVGEGREVQSGDTVSVHYIGTLQNGTEFDNSRKRGTPFEFTVGSGQVIRGWDEGLVGMKVGGQRVLVIPPDMAYGDRAIGPIPPNSTLVFAIELVEIK